MKKIEVYLPTDVADRLEKLAATRGSDYASVNTTEVNGRDAFITDLLILGLDELEATESEFPDDEE